MCLQYEEAVKDLLNYYPNYIAVEDLAADDTEMEITTEQKVSNFTDYFEILINFIYNF